MSRLASFDTPSLLISFQPMFPFQNTAVDGIMIHAPARVCVECQQGGVMAMCAGCDNNLHEMCRAQHECPALAQHKHPTLSQLLHKKYSKYGHRSKPPEVGTSF